MSDTETVAIDPQFQKTMLGTVVRRAMRYGICANCAQSLLLCHCTLFDDGEGGMVREEKQ